MFIKRPGSGRNSFALVGNDGKTITDPRINQINADLKAGVARDLLEARMRQVLASYQTREESVLHISNEKLALACHAYKLKKKPHLTRPDMLKRRLLHGVAKLGNLSLQEATEDQLLTCLAKYKGSRRHEITRVVNELLKFAKRSIHLANPRPPRPEEVTYIRLAEFVGRLSKISDPHYKLYLASLFATGCRFAELPMIQVRPDGSGFTVKSQIREDGTVGLTKNRKSRAAPILPPLKQYVLEFSRLPLETRRALRLEHYNRIYRLCKVVLGVRLHDLRHSYAVEWGAVGTTTVEIADYIGDTPEVCKDRYLNYCALPEVIERAVSRFKKRS